MCNLCGTLCPVFHICFHQPPVTTTCPCYTARTNVCSWVAPSARRRWVAQLTSLLPPEALLLGDRLVVGRPSRRRSNTAVGVIEGHPEKRLRGYINRSPLKTRVLVGRANSLDFWRGETLHPPVKLPLEVASVGGTHALVPLLKSDV